MIAALLISASLLAVAASVMALRSATMKEIRHLATAVDAASKARLLQALSADWNAGEMLKARVIVAQMLKRAPWETESLKSWLKAQGREDDWIHVASIAQFLRRVSTAFETGGIPATAGAIEFRGAAWWAERLGTVYGKFPEEATLSGMMLALATRIRDANSGAEKARQATSS